jgi:predicted Zn finger-like uncharacterized protein
MPAADEDAMNVTCPQCNTVFRVDPAKVPEKGVRARCSVCQGLIAVRRPALAVPPTVEAPLRPAAEPVSWTPPPPTPTRLAPSPAIEVAPVSPPAPSPPPPAPRELVPPVPAPQAAAPPPAPAAPRVERPAEQGGGGAARFANPFIHQDPATRARRLARALVSDLVVYHPEKRQRGLGDGTLKELFAEEIRKSWEEYTEQVGEELANSTPYFTEALNEILAEGRALFD